MMGNDEMLTDLMEVPTASVSNHLRTIIHIDIDCFYAQVEEILCPELRSKPVGIQQKNIIVTCNYVARTFGVGKLQLLTDAQRLCPDLVLVNGEDLTKYRKMSASIFEVLHTFTPNVEKLGMDENYLDVSSLVSQRLDVTNVSSKDISITETTNEEKLQSFVFPVDAQLSSCSCGCSSRLLVGAAIAKEIRDKLYSELGITSCAGVAHNKLLAKWVGSRNKPNAQTVFVPLAAANAMRTYSTLRQITGIGEKTELLLGELQIKTVAELQDAALDLLKRKFGSEMGVKLKEWSFGRDTATVKPSGKPKSIGLEDSCRSISLRADVEKKFRMLLVRLIEQVLEDGRIPIAIKITVRKFDGQRLSSHRETKQANILPSLFRQTGDGKILLNEGGQDKLLKIIMHLFERSVNLNKPFNITLLGLAFSKFQERRKSSRNLANFLIKKSDIEVQSVTNLSSDSYSSPNTTSDQTQTPRYCTSSPMHIDSEAVSDTSHASCSSDVSESEIEPSPKKTRLGLLIGRRRCFARNQSTELASPSKLRVSELRLNCRESDRDSSTSANISSSSVSPYPSMSPSSSVFYSTPSLCNIHNLSNLSVSSNTSSPNKDISDILFDCPPSVDPTVFRELPVDMQQELKAQWRNSSAVSPIGGIGHSSTPKSGTRMPSTSPLASVSPTATSGTTNVSTSGATTASKSNTLHRYFIANSQN